VLEHFHEWEAKPLLEEWRRVLKPRGKLILELPCMDKVLHQLAAVLTAGHQVSPTLSWHVFWGDPKYRDPAMCHRWGYTYGMLERLLLSAGFVRVSFPEPRYHFAIRDMRAEAFKPEV